MPLLKSLYRNKLDESAKLTALLKKIKELAAERASRLVIDFGLLRFRGDELTSFTIDETLSVGTIVFNDGLTTRTFDKADIRLIRRLRTKKWAIEIKANANPA